MGQAKSTSKSKKKKSLSGKPEPSPANMLDDTTGESLMQRPDDTKEALPKRLEAYHNETEPILKHYKSKGSRCRVSRIKADAAMENVWKSTARVLRIRPE